MDKANRSHIVCKVQVITSAIGSLEKVLRTAMSEIEVLKKEQSSLLELLLDNLDDSSQSDRTESCERQKPSEVAKVMAAKSS